MGALQILFILMMT